MMGFASTSSQIRPPSFIECKVHSAKLINPTITTALKENIRTLQKPVTDLPSWVENLCPDIYEHYSKVPYLATYLPQRPLGILSFTDNAPMPIMTSSLGAKSTCLLKLLVEMCEGEGIEVMIYAGGQLGAMLHGGPMPWDDDIDVAIEYRHREKFEELCGETVAGGEVRLGCFRAWNAWKVFKGKGEGDRTHWKHDGYNSPYIDVYFVEERFYWRHPFTRYIREVRPDGETTGEQQFRVDDFYPVEDYYYGGMRLKGPGRAVALRYDLSRCFAGGYNHRLEAYFADAVDKEELEIDCCAMHEVGYPFVKEDGKTLTYRIRNKLGMMERYDVRIGL